MVQYMDFFIVFLGVFIVLLFYLLLSGCIYCFVFLIILFIVFRVYSLLLCTPSPIFVFVCVCVGGGGVRGGGVL